MPSILPRRNVTAFPSVLGAALRLAGVGGARERLEARFVERWGHRVALATSSGRAGLSLLLQASRSRVPPRAYVPAFTIEAVPALVRTAGFEVVFVDVDPETLSLTPEEVRRAWRGPGLLLVTHYFGLPADMGALVPAATEMGLEMLEDCAHAPGARVGDRAVGTFGLGGFFSFESRKPLNGLGGGMAVASDPEAAAWLAAVRRPGMSRVNDAKKLAMTTAEWVSLRPPLFRFVAPLLYRRAGSRGLVSLYRRLHAAGRSEGHAFSDFQASLVLGQMDGLDASISRKRAVAAVYDAGLPRSVTRPVDPVERPHGYYMYVACHPRGREFGGFLRRHGIDCGIGAEVLPACAGPDVAPGTHRVLSTAVELPMHDAMTPEDARRVCAVAARFET